MKIWSQQRGFRCRSWSPRRKCVSSLSQLQKIGEAHTMWDRAHAKRATPKFMSGGRRRRMANVVRDPQEHPEAILPDLSKPDPLLTFKKEDIALVYGSKWKQRYFKKIGDDYLPSPPNGTSHTGCGGHILSANGTDWWATLYPPENMKRPPDHVATGVTRSTTTSRQKTVTEWNVGCERCHGAGSDHVARPPGPTSSILPVSITCRRTIRVSSAIRRDSRCTTRSKENTTTGR